MYGRSGRSPRKDPVITEPYHHSKPLGEMEALEVEAAGAPAGVSEGHLGAPEGGETPCTPVLSNFLSICQVASAWHQRQCAVTARWLACLN